ncbi:PLC-like phosphodiesterase [Cyathus striatus]|nr:PLC-like phosphodiesterase [Cyathus striatus]
MDSKAKELPLVGRGEPQRGQAPEVGEFILPKDVGLDMHIPDELQKGVILTKISEKHKDKKKQVVFKIDPDEGTLKWEREGGWAVQIETIKELRPTQDSLSLHIIYILSATYKSLYLLFPTQDLFVTFHTALSKLHNIRQGLAPSSAGTSTLADLELRDAVWERQYWKGADEEGDQKLDFDDVQRLTNEQVKVLIEGAAPGKITLDFPAFQRFVRKLKYRPELEKVYKHLVKESVDAKAKEREEMDWVAFEKFMRGIRRVKSLFESYATSPVEVKDGKNKVEVKASEKVDGKVDGKLESKPTEKVVEKVETNPTASYKHDMSLPLSAYYISSSHNTYLVGHQLVGVSTTEGCRSVECTGHIRLSSGPVVYHGKTLTSLVSLSDICSAINKYGFVTSAVKGQEEIVDVMEDAFGERLIKVSMKGEGKDGEEGKDEGEVIEGGVAVKVRKLPSPEALMGKVMVKAKNLFEVAKLASINAALVREKAKLEDSSSSSSSDEGEPESGTGGLKDNLKFKWRKLLGEGEGKIKMSLRLASLLVYTVGIKCHGFGPDIPYEPQHMFSLSESKARRLLKANMSDLIRHTQGTRVSSSNYEPHRFWAAGAQVVALNWQTFGKSGYMINQAMFLRNNRVGYVLKPQALREPDSELLKKKTGHFFRVSIISAQQLPRLRDSTGQEIVEKSIVDPFVEVSLHIPDWTHSPFLPSAQTTSSSDVKYSPPKDASATQATQARTVAVKTRVIKNNGFNPVWEEEFMVPFDCVGGMRELIFVEFKVCQEGKDDDDDVPIGSYCAPLGSLESGYRYLPLHDNQMSPYLFSTLFVKIDVRDAE